MGGGVSSASLLARPGQAVGLRSEAEPSNSRSLSDPAPGAEPVASATRRIGILGGTFDPPHVGHLWLATLAADAFALDRVLFMPAARPPHKGGQRVTSAAHRLLMTRLAIAGNPLLELSVIEMERSGPSFTVDSIEELRRLYADAELFLIMAADSLAQIDTWREPDRLLALIGWIVGPRPGVPPPDARWLAERFGAAASRIHLLEGPALDVSASEIRARVAAGRAIRYLVPRAVEELIMDRRLYRDSRTRRS
jgi:nicotinate-nucleotide adenylyltransferase